MIRAILFIFAGFLSQFAFASTTIDAVQLAGGRDVLSLVGQADGIYAGKNCQLVIQVGKNGFVEAHFVSRSSVGNENVFFFNTPIERIQSLQETKEGGVLTLQFGQNKIDIFMSQIQPIQIQSFAIHKGQQLLLNCASMRQE